MKKDTTYKSTKRTFWAAAAFYFLIAFEFAYMAGPLAAFFYGAYSPALGLIGKIPILSELIRFFLPHIVQQTTSPLIDAHNLVGVVLSAAGFLVFLIGACKVYYNKLTKKGAATGGLYKYIRHPQYAAFIVCSFGLLLVWPRYIVAVMFVTMLFAYYLLARDEEKECMEKFGENYSSYMEHTNMFFPFHLLKIKTPTLFSSTKTKGQRVLLGLGLYIAVLTVTIGSAAGLNSMLLNNLYADYTESSATVSLCEMEPMQIRAITDIVLADQMFADRLQAIAPNTAFLNDIMPTQWFSAEVPMNGLEYRSGHKSPANYDKNLYKVILTQVVVGQEPIQDGKEILKSVTERLPLFEVWVNLSENKVTQIMEMPQEVKYQGVPVAIY